MNHEGRNIHVAEAASAADDAWIFLPEWFI